MPRLGFTGGGVHLGLQWLGLHYTTATSGILYLSTSPIFIMLMALPLGERIGARQWLGVLVSFCGVFLIATRGEPAKLSFNIGDLMALGSMVMWAGYTVLLRLRRDPLETVEVLVMVCAFGFLFMTPWLAWELVFNPRIELTRIGALAVAYSAIGSLHPRLRRLELRREAPRARCAPASPCTSCPRSASSSRRSFSPNTRLVPLRRHRPHPCRRDAFFAPT